MKVRTFLGSGRGGGLREGGAAQYLLALSAAFLRLYLFASIMAAFDGEGE